MRLLLFILFIFCADLTATADSTVGVDLVCRVDFPASELLLVDARENDLPDELTGTMFIDGEFYIYDFVSEQLLVVECAGTEKYRYGSKGPGPEDHFTYCDPLLWEGRDPVLVDYALPPKIIRLTSDGDYGGSFTLDTSHNLVRLLWAGDRALGVEVVPRRGKASFVLEVNLVTFDVGGRLIRRMLLDVHTLDLDPNSGRTAEALEVFPRLAYRNDRLFIQRDVYSFVIECFDMDFEMQWRYSEKSERIPDPDPFVHKNLRGVAPAMYLHPVRSMWAQADGGLWIEAETGMGLTEGRLYKHLTAAGEVTSDVTLLGLPVTPGTLAYREDMIVWSDINVEAGDGERSIRLYRKFSE